MERFGTIEKSVGETPLQALERFRQTENVTNDVPLAYAGRLDPMASGTLLVLIGDECKVQEKYHELDKEYQIEILFGVHSDTGDVLGRLDFCEARKMTENELGSTVRNLVGTITLPYPHFSSKTVHGKPLHVWTLENRLNEITIPTKTSRIYKLHVVNIRTISKEEVYRTASEKIETIPKVTEASKELGNDFRRKDVRADWKAFLESRATPLHFQLARMTCIASSGTYMRTLAEEIAKDLGTCALAYSIHRTTVGKYVPVTRFWGFWAKKYR